MATTVVVAAVIVLAVVIVVTIAVTISAAISSAACYILEEIEWAGVVEVGHPLVRGWLG